MPNTPVKNDPPPPPRPSTPATMHAPPQDKHMPDTPPTPRPDFSPPKDFKMPKPGDKDWVQGAPESDEEASKTEADAKKKLEEGKKVYDARDKALGIKTGE